MSTRKRPLRELSQAPQTPRAAPTTPHAIKALQQRSGVGQRSARVNRLQQDVARPTSARGILRRLAKATAPETKRRISTPIGKENAPEDAPDGKQIDSDETESLEFTLPIVDEVDDEDESELGAPPTPTALLEDDRPDPTITFQNVPLAPPQEPNGSEKRARSSLRKSGISQTTDDEDDGEADHTIELGRRAVSEVPVDRYPRSSFGSIRMSDFGVEEQRRTSVKTVGNPLVAPEDDHFDPGIGLADNDDLDQGYVSPDFWRPALIVARNETEELGRVRRSLSASNVGHSINIQSDHGLEGDQTFQLDLPVDAEARSNERPGFDAGPIERVAVVDEDDEFEDEMPESDRVSSQSRNHGQHEVNNTVSRAPRKKRTKLTCHGTMVPALPSSLIKRLATEAMTKKGRKKPRLDRASVIALEQATEWFFEQVGEDLAAYSNHAGRKKTVDASDVLTLFKRQKVLGEPGALQAFAEEHLDAKSAAELDLPESL